MRCKNKRCMKELSDDWIYCPFCGRKQTPGTRKAIKRENGTGTVYKRSDLKTRPWVAATPTTNTEASQVIGHYDTAQAAKDALDDYRRNPTTKLNITVEQVYDEWSPLGYKGKSKQQRDCYNASWRHMQPVYGIKFRELRTAQMQAILDGMQEERQKLDKKGNQIIKDGVPQALKPYSFSAISKVKFLFGQLYQYAMENDIVNKDYSKFLMLPKNEPGPKDRFTDLEVKQIENAVEKVPFADCVLMLCYTGYRINEFLRLNKLSAHKVGDRLGLIGGEKTKAGKDRLMPVHPKIQPLFEAWIAKDGDTIICRDDGTAYSAKYFREKCYYPALEQIGVRKLPPHAARRTFSTRGSAAGMRPEDLIALMGHTDFSVDVESYINQEFETLAKAVEKIP